MDILNGINVLSLFDGISCGQQVLKELDIKVSNYYASEIEAATINIALDNFPETKQIGDVKNIDAKELDIHLLLGGSPCQGFSFNGKQANFNDPRSKLFFEYVRILNDIKKYNPDIKFLLENVRMKKEYQDVISELLGVEPIQFDSEIISGCHRRRLYWTNILGFEIPNNKNINLQDVLQNNVEDKYFLSGKRLDYWIREGEKRCKKVFSSLDRKKAICQTARQYANWNGNHVTDNGKVRQLTPIECERLHNLPDDYTKVATDTERYKALGNGWDIGAVKLFLKNLK